MEHLKIFDTEAQYNAYAKSDEYVAPNVSLVAGETVKYNKETPIDYSSMYFTVKALEPGTIVWNRKGMEVPKYRINGGEWISNEQTGSYNIQVDTNDTVEFSYNPTAISSSHFYNFITVSTDYEVYGNIFSLMYGDDFIGQTAYTKNIPYNYMFGNQTHLISSENLVLPALEVVASAYTCMFQGCSAMTKGPEILPATTLGVGCYHRMFGGCKSLESAPELPAMTLAADCYNWMFEHCEALTTAPILPSTSLTNSCYYRMFADCTSLTTVPELPALTLTENCYYGMFMFCSNLNYIKCLATDISATKCTEMWVESVPEIGTFVKNNQMQNWQQSYGDYNGIPYGWTVQDAE